MRLLRTKFSKHVYKLLKKHINIEIPGVIISLLLSVDIVIVPYVSKRLIDAIVQTHSFSSVKMGMVVFFIACFLQSIFIYLNVHIFTRLSNSITLNIKNRLFQRVIRAPFAFFDKVTSGTIISRLINDSNNFGSFLTNSMFSILQNIFYIILLSVGMVLISVKISIFLFAFLLIYILFNVLISKRFEKVSAKVLENQDTLLTDIKQSITNIETVKTLSLEQHLGDQFLGITTAGCNVNIRKDRMHGFIDSMNSTIVVSAMGIIYGLGFYLVSKDQLTVGGIVAFDFYFRMIINPIYNMINTNINLKEITPTLKRLADFFELESEKLAKVSLGKGTDKNQIQFKNISFGYENTNKLVLDHADFCFKGNGIFGIVGESGCGKSTVARLILDLHKPTAGSILVKVGDMPKIVEDRNVRECVGYASQNMQLFSGTVRKNLKLNKNITDDEMVEICQKLNLHKKITSLPKGYDTAINENINFSGGETQRLVLARAYLKHLPINVLDEVTSALDTKSLLLVKAVIEEMAKSSLVVLITHNKKVLSEAKAVLSIKNGKVEVKSLASA